jgi:HEAT repeat protein
VDENVRAAATTVLGARRVRAPGLVARVLALAKDPSFIVRGASARAALGVGATFAEAMPVLLGLLADVHPSVVLDALDALAGYGPEAAAALTELRKDRLAAHPDPAVREKVRAAIRALAGK